MESSYFYVANGTRMSVSCKFLVLLASYVILSSVELPFPLQRFDVQLQQNLMESTYFYVATSTRKSVSCTFLALHASYALPMVVEALPSTRAILPTP
jgi:hypothetical protein